MKRSDNELNEFNKLVRKAFYVGLPIAMLTAVPAETFANVEHSKAVEAFQAAQQNKTIKGNVKDETGLGLPGVSVVVKGTTMGTITDYDGNYTLEVPENAEVVFSYIGYKPQTIKVAGKTMINLDLVPDQQALEEVVVIGYGTVKKRDLTGAVTSIKSEDITLSPTANPMAALQGKVAGLDITRSSGKAGSGVSMQLRGNRSLSASGEPLFIIDGMPGDYGTLNPNDIESIEILKDASSTAVYGAAGANGVIIIYTKKAKEGKPLINFNAYVGYNGWATVPEVRIGDSYMQLRRDAQAAIGNWSSPADDQNCFPSAGEWDAVQNNKWVDWADHAIGNGYQQNYSMSVSGGTENTKAYFSLNFSDEKGIYANDNNKIYSLRTNIDQTINKWITAGMSVQVSYTHNNARKGILSKAMSNVPLGDPFMEDGSINPTPIPDSGAPNIMTDEMPGVYKNQTKNTRVYANVYMDWKPFKGLSLRTIA
ncbi:MAG: SusC/RagA family TonB-linked outer membrane protein, partial [Bacteroidales bacterium]